MRSQILFFIGEDCPACEIVKEIIKPIAAKHRTKINYIDPTENIELAAEYEVRILPTIVYKDNTLEGLVKEEDIVNLFA